MVGVSSMCSVSCLISLSLSYICLFLIGICWLSSLPEPENYFLNQQPYRIHKYPGVNWYKEGRPGTLSLRTLQVKTLLQNKWMQIQEHKVLTENGKIIPDWIWMDVIDQINVLVHVKSATGEDQFILTRQDKYGLKKLSWAVTGGHIDMAHNEDPLDCAKRELLEEMGLISDEWIQLGSEEGFRTNVNRGQGMVHLFLAKNSRRKNVLDKDNPESQIQHSPFGQIASKNFMKQHAANDDELESQKFSLVSLSELKYLLLNGLIAEIKWTANVALALLYLQNENKTIDPVSMSE